MEELLSRLYSRLTESFEENITKSNDLKRRENDGNVDVLQTLLSLSVHQKTIHGHMHKGAISIDELKCIDSKGYDDCIEEKFILKGNGLYSNKAFIGLNGIFEYYRIKNWDYKDALQSYDLKTFPIETYTLKTQEKVWCVFLILMGADSSNNIFNTSTFSKTELEKNYEFLIKIENKLLDKKINLGKRIKWTTGKEKTFRGLIGCNKDLPKTGVYINPADYKYYLDLDTKKNASYLMDLILDKYTGVERINANDIFYEVLQELSKAMVFDLRLKSQDINKNIREVLRG